MMLVDFEKELREQVVKLEKEFIKAFYANDFEYALQLQDVIDPLKLSIDRLMWFQTKRKQNETPTN